MSVQVENLEKNMAKLTIEVAAEKVEDAIQAAYMKEKGKISVPGFRKGKVPRKMIEKMYGAGVFYEDAANTLIQENYAQAVEESGVDVVSRPTIEVVQIEAGKPFIFTAEVAVRPEVKLGKYKGVQVTKIDTTVSDEEVAAELEKERQKNSRTVTVTDRPIAEGDTAVIDFEGFVDGVAFEGGKGENHPLEIGSHSFIDTFEDQLVGKNAGDEVDVNVTFPEKYQAADLAGKPALFKVKIHEVKAKEVPALDDELAKDIDEEVETLAELKEKYRKELAEAKEEAYNDAVEAAAIDLAVENAEIVELPEEMIHEEVHRSINEFLGNMQRQGISPEMYFQITGTTQEDLHKQYEAEAESRTKTNLVVEAVAKAEGFEATEEEINAEIEQLAADYNMPVEQVRNLLSPEMLKHDITVKKAVNVITSTAKVK